jgi:hypothetical protein
MDGTHMDEPSNATEPVTDERQDWVTPELVVEDVKEITRGGTGPYPIIGGEEQTSAFYHS